MRVYKGQLPRTRYLTSHNSLVINVYSNRSSKNRTLVGSSQLIIWVRLVIIKQVKISKAEHQMLIINNIVKGKRRKEGKKGQVEKADTGRESDGETNGEMDWEKMIE